LSPLVSTYFLQRQSDERLVTAACTGNERAFEVLVKRHHQQLLAYARRLTGTDPRAEDALQQALLQAWVALRGDAHPEQFKPWLFRIVHNVVVSGLRRSQHATVGLDEALETAERVDSVEARMAFREALAGLAALPEPQRRAIVLTALGGSSHDEAGVELGLSSGAVRGLIYRARATLRSAAALLPAPLAAWVLNRPRRSTVGERTAELLAGSSSVGAGGLIVKAGAIAATAGALAAGTQILPGLGAAHHHGARNAVRLADRDTAAGGASQPAARTGLTVLVASTDRREQSTTAAVSAVGGATGRGRDGVKPVGGRPRTGESRPSGEHGSGGMGSHGGSRQSSGGGDSSVSSGGDSGHSGSGGSPAGGGGDSSSGTGTTLGGHDLSGSDGGAGGGATPAVSSESGDGSSAGGGSGSAGGGSDGGTGGGGSDSGSSTPTGSSGGGGDTTTTPGGD
jgi:RNA polymerase sigma factor (sigma-70 family)